MIIVLYDTPQNRLNFYPFSFTRSISSLLCGIYSIGEWWQIRTALPTYPISAPLLHPDLPQADSYLCIDATVLADDSCMQQLLQLNIGQSLCDATGLIGFHKAAKPVYQELPIFSEELKTTHEQKRIKHPIELMQQNATAIAAHFKQISASKNRFPPSSTNQILGNQLFLGSNVQMEYCTINTLEGPVIIGENALIMEGTCIRGPVAIGANAVIKMGTKIYGGTSIGKHCTIGGEVKNSIIGDFSNKAHDGYLGDSMMGEWCNLGAGTSNSNVKNNAGEVTVWNHATQSWLGVGKKCGTIMGDYSRTAINTSLNTGTVIGTCSSIHGGNIPPKHVPSFKWGADEDYELSKVLQDVSNWKAFKQQSLTASEQEMLIQLYDHIIG